MASPELAVLWRLAEIDRKLLEVRKRASALDIGQKIQAEIDALQAEDAKVGGEARRLSQELLDLELAQKSADDKLAKIDKDIYGGKVVSSREIEALEREVEMVKRNRDRDTERILELYELVPPAKEAAAKLSARIEDAKRRLAERRKTALVEKSQLEAAFKQLTESRPGSLRGISPGLLTKYEGIRQRHGGIGMVEANRGKGTCGGCGTALPERTFAALSEDRMTTCEECHRILYYTEGVV